jgi:hypothetical protein
MPVIRAPQIPCMKRPLAPQRELQYNTRNAGTDPEFLDAGMMSCRGALEILAN